MKLLLILCSLFVFIRVEMPIRTQINITGTTLSVINGILWNSNIIYYDYYYFMIIMMIIIMMINMMMINCINCINCT